MYFLIRTPPSVAIVEKTGCSMRCVLSPSYGFVTTNSCRCCRWCWCLANTTYIALFLLLLFLFYNFYFSVPFCVSHKMNYSPGITITIESDFAFSSYFISFLFGASKINTQTNEMPLHVHNADKNFVDDQKWKKDTKRKNGIHETIGLNWQYSSSPFALSHTHTRTHLFHCLCVARGAKRHCTHAQSVFNQCEIWIKTFTYVHIC